MPTPTHPFSYPGNRVLALVVAFALFGYIAKLAPRYILGDGMPNALVHGFEAMCADVGLSGEQPYRITYTGLKPLDGALCGVVFFFQLSLTPQSLPSVLYLAWTHGALVLIPMIEAKRRGALFPMTFPMLFWQAYQFFTIGVAEPWYWLAFVATQFLQTLRNGGQTRNNSLSNIDAESIVVAFIVGDIFPFAAMLYFKKTLPTAIWQIFPLVVGLVQMVYVPARKALSVGGNGHGFKMLRGLKVLVFVASVLGHWSYIFPLLETSGESTARELAEKLLKRDYIFGYGSCMLGTMWFAETIKQALGLGLWNIVGCLIVGPGAVLAGTSIWRE